MFVFSDAQRGAQIATLAQCPVPIRWTRTVAAIAVTLWAKTRITKRVHSYSTAMPAVTRRTAVTCVKSTTMLSVLERGKLEICFYSAL